ncbi:MAG: proton-conducting transporter membrane subunit [Acidimicrobiales bacterium]
MAPRSWWRPGRLARPDAKGALALSTSAQMGFMLLAVGVGAPGAALTHLAGHAC